MTNFRDSFLSLGSDISEKIVDIVTNILWVIDDFSVYIKLGDSIFCSFLDVNNPTNSFPCFLDVIAVFFKIGLIV